jgi:2-oxoglutarate ferredoxin oxidoreductase subunit beta
VRHKGFSLVDILQPCVSFNKVNTFAWYKERVYKLGQEHDPRDFGAAMDRAMEFGERIPHRGDLRERPAALRRAAARGGQGAAGPARTGPGRLGRIVESYA